MSIELYDWKYFHDLIYQRLLDYRSYIFRGHRRDDWNLESTLDRSRGGQFTFQRKSHLEAFKLAVRGWRGPNPARLETENDWWALGQHHGLKTPLLDWTKSPFVAAYFAFIGDKHDNTERRVIWALHRPSIEDRSKELAAAHTGKGRPSIVEFFTPLSDENTRLVNQGGLFTRAPDNNSLEDWLTRQFPDDHSEANTLIALKITVPNSNRAEALRSLNRMNINHLTLFPDLFGASTFCNTDLDVSKY